MDILSSLATKNAEAEFTQQLRMLADAGASVIQVRTREVFRAVRAVRKAVLLEGHHYHEWNVVNGNREFTASTLLQEDTPGDNNLDLMAALRRPQEALRDPEIVAAPQLRYYCFVQSQFWLNNNPIATHLLMTYAALLPASNLRVILITPDQPLPEALADYAVTVRFAPPGHGELREALELLLDNLEEPLVFTDKEKDALCYTAAGLSKDQFDLYVSQAIVEGFNSADGVTVDGLISSISRGKTDIVNKNNLLELYTTESMQAVAGLDNLKHWVRKRIHCFSDEARAFGVEPPKGIILLGIPGTGKTLFAKSVAKEFGIPLVRLDFGRMFGSLVGQSEQQIRTALQMASDMAPVVLFCDEAEKGLQGTSSGAGDSGTSSRVLGTFLTWLQDNKAPVFTVMTTNNISHLPPELTRRGRFEAIFAVGLPTARDRLAALQIHLHKRGWDPAQFKALELQSIAKNDAVDFTPAEIESAVKDALVEAFAQGEPLQLQHLRAALAQITPLARSHAEQIAAMLEWAKTHALPASLPETMPGAEPVNGPRARRRIRTTLN